MANFCSNCGSKVSADDKFCSKCGNKLEIIEENEESVKTVNTNNGKENGVNKLNKKTVRLYNYEIDVTDILAEKAIMEKSNALAELCTKDFISTYNSIGSLKGAMAKLPEISKKSYMQASEYYVNEMRKVGIYHISADDFLDKCIIYTNSFIEEYKALCDAYNKLSGEKIAGDIHRHNRKEMRTRISGGGFSILGAAQGIAIAGIANIATGMAHSIYNDIEEKFSNMSLEEKMNAIYKKSGMRLKNALYNDIYCMMVVHIKIVAPNFNWTFNPNNQDHWINIKKSIDENKVPKDKIGEYVVRIVTNLANKENIYLWAYKMMGDEKGELEIFAKTFGFVDVANTIKQKKNEIASGVCCLGEKYEKFVSTYKNTTTYKLTKECFDSSILDIAARLYFGMMANVDNNLFILLDNDYIRISSKNKDGYTAFDLYQNAKESYCKKTSENEIPIFQFVTPKKVSFFKGVFDGNNGFLMTTKKIYFKSMNFAGEIPLEKINRFVDGEGAILINDIKLELYNIERKEIKKICQILSYLRTLCDVAAVASSQTNLFDKKNIAPSKTYLGALKLIWNMYLNDSGMRFKCIGLIRETDKKINKALDSFVPNNESEMGLFYSDNSENDDKYGVLVTTKGIRYRNSDQRNSEFISWENVKKLERFDYGFYVNDNHKVTLYLVDKYFDFIRNISKYFNS